jgi:TolC family type I secretion outer membrane protein
MTRIAYRPTCRRPRAWALAAAIAVLFDGPGVASAETLTDALIQTYNSNPRLLADRARLRATDETVAQAMSGWRPTLTLSGDAGKQYTYSESTSATSVNTGSGDNRTPRGASITLSQNIFRGFRTVASVRRADFLVQSDRARLLDTEQQVLLAAATSYVDVFRDQAVVQLNFNNERVLQQQLEATRNRFQVGEVTLTDVSQAESRLARALADRIAAEGNLATSRAVYQTVVGVAPGTLEAPPPLGDLPATIADARRVASERAFPVMLQYYVERAAREQVDVIFGEMLPLVTVGGELSRRLGASGPDSRTETASVTARLTVPLYEAGSITARVREAKEVAAQQRRLLDQQIRASTETATRGWDALQTAQAQVTAFTAEVRAAEIALRGVQQEAQVGSRTVLDVLDAEQELLNAQVNLVRARHDVVVSSYNLRSATATLTARQLGLAVDLYEVEKHYEDTRLRWWGLSTEERDGE